MKILMTMIAVALCITACSTAPALSPEQAYLKGVHDSLDDSKYVFYDEKLLTAGQAVCNAIPDPGVTHSRIVAVGGQALADKDIPDPYGASEVITTSAERYLCPTIKYTPITRNAG